MRPASNEKPVIYGWHSTPCPCPCPCPCPIVESPGQGQGHGKVKLRHCCAPSGRARLLLSRPLPSSNLGVWFCSSSFSERATFVVPSVAVVGATGAVGEVM